MPALCLPVPMDAWDMCSARVLRSAGVFCAVQQHAGRYPSTQRALSIACLVSRASQMPALNPKGLVTVTAENVVPGKLVVRGPDWW